MCEWTYYIQTDRQKDRQTERERNTDMLIEMLYTPPRGEVPRANHFYKTQTLMR